MSTRKLRRGKYRPSNSSNSISGKSRIIRRAVPHRREIDHGKKWYVIRANAGCERRVELGLRASGCDIFRPVDDCWRVYRHRCSDTSRGWFGRYLFVGLGGRGELDIVRATDGVAGILGTATEGAIAVRPEVLQAVADQISGFSKPAPAAFSEGQDVLVQAGPFAELKATVEEADAQSGRATVRLEMFGKEHLQVLDFVDLKAA